VVEVAAENLGDQRYMLAPAGSVKEPLVAGEVVWVSWDRHGDTHPVTGAVAFS